MNPLPLFTLLILLIGMVISGCSGDSSSSDESGGLDLKGPVIGASLECQSLDESTTVFSANVSITNQGAPVTDAAVTLLVPGPGSVPLTNDGRGVYSDENSGTWTYQPGQVYSFQVVFGGGVYSASVTTPGAIFIPAHVSGLPVTWSFPGNLNVAAITKLNSGNTSQFTVNLVSPWTPPAEAVSSFGIYEVEVSCSRTEREAFDGGASLASFITAEDELGRPVTNP